MKKHLLLWTLLLSIFSCNKGKIIEREKLEIRKDSLITIIFEKRDYSKDTLRFTGGSYSPTIDLTTYSKNYDYRVFKLTPNNFQNNDTIIINSVNGINLEHKYHYYYRSIYNIKSGDTVLFKYKDGIPLIEFLNRHVAYHDFNFLTMFNVNNDKPVSREEFYLNNKRFRNKNENNKYSKARVDLQLKLSKSIDSLQKNKIISKESALLNNTFLQFSNPGLFIKENYDNELLRDSLLHLSTYRDFLNNYTQHKFKISTIQKAKYETIINYKSLFDSIAKNKELYSKKNRDYLLFENLLNIANEFSLDDFDEYYKKFVNYTNDSAQIEYLKKNYFLELSDLKTATDKVYLINNKQQKLILSEILEKNKGKVVYVDFWASWCAPCRAVMPDSRKLREKYNDKDVLFIFISIDKEFTKWEEASLDENLEHYDSNFLAINYPTASFYSKLKLDFIPRYMIYNKIGELANSNSVAPSGDTIMKILDSYLAEE